MDQLYRRKAIWSSNFRRHVNKRLNPSSFRRRPESSGFDDLLDTGGPTLRSSPVCRILVNGAAVTCYLDTPQDLL